MVTPISSNNSNDSHSKSTDSETNFISMNKNILEATMHALVTAPKIIHSQKEEPGRLNVKVNTFKAIASPLQIQF